MAEDDNIIAALKKGDRSLLNKIYSEYRDKFAGWAAKQFNANEDMAIEIYQDSVVAMYENIHSGKLAAYSGSIQSYLFAIGRNKFLENVRYKKKNSSQKEEVMNMHVVQEDDEYDTEEDEKIDLVSKAIKAMGPPCKTLLQYFYYEKKSMDEIADIMEYKNRATAKNQKYKCLQRLKKSVLV